MDLNEMSVNLYSVGLAPYVDLILSFLNKNIIIFVTYSNKVNCVNILSSTSFIYPLLLLTSLNINSS